MSDSIPTAKFIRSLNLIVERIANFLFNFILMSPIKSILIPCIVSLFIAYPIIYNFYINPNIFFYSLVDNSKIIKYVDFSNNLTHEESSLIMNIFSFEYHSNLLNKDFMLEFHDIQKTLFANITDNIIYSPMDYWNNDKLRILYDNNILKTVQLCESSLNGYSPLNNIQLIANIQKSNGLVIGANVLRILSYSSTFSNFTSNIDFLISKYPNLKVTSISTSVYPNLKLLISYKLAGIIEKYYIYSVIPLLLILGAYKLKANKVIKSKLGIFFAFFIQLILTSLASLSIISYIFKDEYYHILELPIPLLIVVPFIINSVNIRILVHSFMKFSTELSFASRIHNIIKHSLPLTTYWNALSLVIVFSFYLKTNNRESLIFTVFALSSIILNYFLIITYFSAVIIIFFNNVELQDLIQSSNNNDLKNPLSELTNNGVYAEENKNNISQLNNFNNTNNIQSKNNIFNIIHEIIIHKSFILLVLIFVVNIHLVYQWTEGTTYHLINSVNNEILDIFLSKRGFAYELSKLSNDNVALQILNPILFSDYNIDNSEKLRPAIISSNYNSLFFFEFISFLIFIISSATLILKLTINNEFKNLNLITDKLSDNKSIRSKNSSLASSSNMPYFHSKDLVNGHVLDIVKVCTSQCPFIVSVGIDHKILVWSPMKIPIPVPTLLPIGSKFLPISHIEMSNSGSLIIVFSRSGEIKCWSRYSMSWIWTVSVDALTNNTPLVAFFRKRTHISTGRRKLVSRNSKTLKEKSFTTAKIPSKLSNVVSTTPASPTIPNDTLLENPKPSQLPPKINKKMVSPTPTPSPSPSQTSISNKPKMKLKLDTELDKSIKPVRRTSLDSNFDQAKSHEETTNNEFLIVLKNGSMISIDCVTGKTESTILTNSTLLCAKKLVSPRVNDRIVGIKDNGELIVSTVVNNKWKSRPVKIDTSNYNTGKSLITPAILMKYQEFNHSSPNSPSASISSPTNDYFDFAGAHKSTPLNINDNTNNVNKKVDFNDDFEGIIMETVPFVGMIVRAFGLNCQLIDVQTGISLKEWKINKFKQNTFKVFHSEPSHCRFCGCVSVESFSVAYTEIKTNSLVMHTFSIDNRAKNNICLRVERDSRETRCLGFASVTEHQYILSNVEEWCSTDINILVGIRKKENNNNNNNNNNLVTINGIQANDSSSSGLRSRLSTGKKEKISANIDDNVVEGRQLSDIWEGWTMSADGQIKCYQIPNGQNSGLLIKKLGPVSKFGHKSIVVSFGNIMKVLYLGNDNLIEEGEPNNENLSSSPMYQSSGSLSFINRRRKLHMKKYDLTHSTNFEDAMPESIFAMS